MTRDKRMDLLAYRQHNRRIALIEARFQELWVAAYERFKKEHSA